MGPKDGTMEEFKTFLWNFFENVNLKPLSLRPTEHTLHLYRCIVCQWKEEESSKELKFILRLPGQHSGEYLLNTFVEEEDKCSCDDFWISGSKRL